MKQGIIVPKEELEAFGRRVRSIREHLRLRQNEFAAGLELSEGYLCQIEKKIICLSPVSSVKNGKPGID
jgi:DNA-binding transcriptional regulator YiaG